ncbi:hypothetical protein L1885_18140, partial [Streptomyces fuscigenes]|nr:hypothetical protein [Streptomyces fuscigenes]
RRLEQSFSAVDFFEQRGIGFVVAVNEFDGAFRYSPDEIRSAIRRGIGLAETEADAKAEAEAGTAAAPRPSEDPPRRQAPARPDLPQRQLPERPAPRPREGHRRTPTTEEQE